MFVAVESNLKIPSPTDHDAPMQRRSCSARFAIEPLRFNWCRYAVFDYGILPETSQRLFYLAMIRLMPQTLRGDELNPNIPNKGGAIKQTTLFNDKSTAQHRQVEFAKSTEVNLLVL